jgi:prophage DNA circulation protein
MGSGAQAPMPILPETWTVKEVIADFKTVMGDRMDKQDGMLMEIDRKVDSKADKADVQAVVASVVDLTRRTIVLEQHKTETESARRFRNRAWAIAGSIASVLALGGAALLSGLVK